MMIGKETPEIKYDRALTLFQESVLKLTINSELVHTTKIVLMNLWRSENMYWNISRH